MAVYVDPLMCHGGSATFRWKHSCHMYADSLEELHAFAHKLRLKRAWFQDKRVPHYDLNANKYKQAVALGAVCHSRLEAVTFWRDKGWFPPKLAEFELAQGE